MSEKIKQGESALEITESEKKIGMDGKFVVFDQDGNSKVRTTYQ